MEQAVPVVLGCSCLIQFARKKNLTTQRDALEVTFKDENPLELIVEGKSGTGKSRLIKALQWYLVWNGWTDLLVVCASCAYEV